MVDFGLDNLTLPKLLNYNTIVRIPSLELPDCNATTHTPSSDITRNHDH
jgi:hypothetical protein